LGKPGTGGSFDSENIKEFKLEVLRFWKFLRKPDTEVLNNHRKGNRSNGCLGTPLQFPH
jgi:hypothetical protein